MKITKFNFLLMLFTILLFSCSQEDETLEPTDIEFAYDVKSKIQYSKINVLYKGFAGARGGEQMLVFPDKETFLQTIIELERQTEELDDAFIEFYSDLDEEQINEKEEEIGFNENVPIYGFNDELGFESLFQKIAEEEEEWLAQEELDLSEDPDDYFVDDEGYRAVLNADNEVQVGESIYKLTEEGYFQITDGNVESLREIGGKSTGRIALPENIIFVPNKNYDENGRVSASGHKSSKSDSGFKKIGDRRIKWKVKHATPFFGSRHVYAQTKNYKKKGRRWKKYRTYVYAQVYGNISGSGGNCNTQVDFNPGLISSNSKSNKKKVKHKIWVQTKTKSGWVKGNHNGAGGVEYKSTLTF